MKKLYLYPIWVRLWHWTNVLLFIILIVSGVSLHFAGSSDLFFTFETAMLIHNATGIMLIIDWLVFLIGNLLSNNSKHYRIEFRGLFNRLMKQSHYYAIGIFKGEPHPFHVSADMKFNPLQQISYIAVMYGLMPILIISGLLFLFPTYLPNTLMGIGSIWVVAMIHLIVAYLLILFMLVHIYIITTGESVLSKLRAMFTGWH